MANYLTLRASQTHNATEAFSAEMAEEREEQGAAAMLTHTEDGSVEMKDEKTEEVEGEPPTLAAILRAVNKCTASVNNLQERFGSLRSLV